MPGRLLRITTVPESLRLLLDGQLQFMQQQGFKVEAVSSGGAGAASGSGQGIPHHTVHLTRKITPFTDLLALFQLIGLMIRLRPQIVHTHTPKAGLLGMLAAWICRIPVRLHTVAGLPLMEAKGLKKGVLKFTEYLTCACAHQVYPNSFGLLQYMERNFPAFRHKFMIIGKGSSNGINTQRFTATPVLLNKAHAIRKRFGISNHAVVIGFVGRVVKDKGIHELTRAFQEVLRHMPDCWLLLVGNTEPHLDPLDSGVEAYLKSHPRIIMPGFQEDVRPWMLAMDILALPSYREGFPNVVMQAACLQIPCVVSDITGCNELIEHRKTGLVVPPANEKALAGALLELITNRAAAKGYAQAAREYVIRHFEQQTFWQELLREYHRQIVAAGRRTAYICYIKPFFDRLAALVMMAATMPLWLPVIPLLALQNRGKVFFWQERPGLYEKPFCLWKFKTMTDKKNAEGMLLPDELRLTPLGKWIRKTSVDELPQLINVLKGEMSLVGPRPLLMEYLPLYNQRQRLRHNVKPGITGWAQVNGRNTLNWFDRFEYDVWYVENISFTLDMKILFLTALKVLKAEGINSPTAATMEKFTGNVQQAEWISDGRSN